VVQNSFGSACILQTHKTGENKKEENMKDEEYESEYLQ